MPDTNSLDPNPSAPRQRRSPQAMQQLRREILARAREIYRDEGLAALSMRRVAEEFGLSTMSLYSYFPSKHALLNGLWIEVYEDLLERLLLAPRGVRGPLKVFEAHLRAFLDFWEQRADQYRMIFMSAGPSAGATQVDLTLERHPVYAKLLLLLLMQERVAACAGPAEPSARSVRMSSDLVLARLMGYLQLAIALQRYRLFDRDSLRERAVQDLLRDARQGFAD